MSDNSRYDRLRELFEQAIDQSPDAQADLLDRLESEDGDLATQLRRLLARDRADKFDALSVSEASARQAAEELAPPVVSAGRRIGSFEVVEQLGAGGMGHVYRVIRRDGQVEQQAALKLVRSDVLNPELLRRFSTERRMLAALDHSGVCRFLDAGVLPEGVPWVLMELVEGEHLVAYCDRLRLGVEARLRLLRKVLAAVDHAHRNLVLHRDIKSANVLVAADGGPKLLDFGIAKWLAEGEQGVTATADRFLTPSNAAPEQILGRATGIACDIYQLGLLAYELLCGDPPFQLAGLRAAEVERLILEHPPVPMSQRTIADDIAQARGLSNSRALARRLSGDLDSIVQRCLRKAPGERYASVADLDADISRALDGRAVKARGSDRLYRLGRFAARHRVAVALSAALAATLIGGSIALALQTLEASRQRDMAVQERDRAQHAVAVLRDAFAAADPARSAGADVRARHILDAARERIEPLFEAQPGLYAELAETLAEVELSLASDSEAAELAGRGLQAAETGGGDPDVVRRLRILRAQGLIKAGDYVAAEALMRMVEAEDSEVQADQALVQAQLASIDARIDDGVALLEAALSRVAERDAGDELATQIRWELAAALRLGSRTEQSLAVLDETLEWQKLSLPETHPRLLLTRLRRFNIESEGGAGEEAIAGFQPTLELILGHYGPDSSMAALVHSVLGVANARVGHRDAAIAHYRHALAGRRRALGEDHANTLRTMLNLASALGNSDEDQDEAEALYREALRVGERRFGSTREMVVYSRTLFARFLGRQGRWHEALELAVAPGSGLGVVTASKGNNRWQATVLREVLEGAGCNTQVESSDAPACAYARGRIEILEGGAKTEQVTNVGQGEIRR